MFYTTELKHQAQAVEQPGISYVHVRVIKSHAHVNNLSQFTVTYVHVQCML